MPTTHSCSCLKDQINPVLIDQYLCDNFLESCKKPNYEPAMNTDYAFHAKPKNARNFIVNKTYEKYKNTLSESYFDVSDKEEAREFIDDYAKNLNDGLILVMNSEVEIDEVINLSTGVQNCIKLIIRYSTNNNKSDVKLKESVEQIKTNSIKNAVNEAYSRVKNGQAILFAHVNSNFDFFEHMENM